MVLEVPCIDLACDRNTVARQIRDACMRYGFFYVSNHGIPEELIQRQFEETRKFFALPLEVKKQMLINDTNRGYQMLGEQTLDPSIQTRPDTKEGVYIGREIDSPNPPRHAGRNQWPPEDLVPEYRSTMMSYFNACAGLAERLIRHLALSLNLPEHYFDSKVDDPVYLLRPLHYSAEMSDPDKGVLAAGAHCDYGVITILGTDDEPGLQIFVEDNWLDVPPIPGTLVINVGEMVERLTNGMYKSILHRVVNTTGKERYSTPFFADPNWDAVIAPLPTCCVDRPPQYPAMTCGELITHKYSKVHSSYKGRELPTFSVKS